ncbi:D-alanyl-D-alanine carboxypeptidase/D-alanyl-D-alanine endopeptidase [Oceanomicrobium pacificus]|uniref:D-alanyl-D-alanine carboxypeptidase/D-alanyl-D-alanine-endopeptidase n=1 Tax=Oceanomicrobium pacificus TaxID=2692916 RepID=A0A6B0TL53_9RHOB|nr:D-alanyl-D-alanine carboxypeptidase/D-alanyl-D-alanine-endopeptidase [Oceanomicrobium pacificus]MXU64606.1 D-alanyl-D-alanine carboxypeptidase/D-alanyl-D-alanine-endopeptidase [Oceanomicrobium pacificus]
MTRSRPAPDQKQPGRKRRLSRRHVLAGLGAATVALPGAASAASLRFDRPIPRGGGPKAAPQMLGSVMEGLGLADKTGVALIDFDSGEILETHQPAKTLPPASVAKAVTAMYALDSFGPDHTFRTRILATGPVQDGRVNGDLVLVGGADPHLDSDHLALLARQVVANGIHGVNGHFIVIGSALPFSRHIDPTQPASASYNPSVGGLNLNFNRVFFQWKPGADLLLTLKAQAERHQPDIRTVRIDAVDRASPVFNYRSIEGRDHWTVARPALKSAGGQWLPVRTPELYAGETFRAVASQYGLRLPDAILSPVAMGGEVVAEHHSIPLSRILRSMLIYSTNLTAEVVGMSASINNGAGITSIAESGAAMSDWMATRLGGANVGLVNHSGLSDQSRLSAMDMVRSMQSPADRAALIELMRTHRVSDGSGGEYAAGRAFVKAKTGTMHFTRGLSGLIRSGEKTLGFAIFAADLDLRAANPSQEGFRPRGSRSWSSKAKGQEQLLLRRWIDMYG